jgi:hypothetical protein
VGQNFGPVKNPRRGKLAKRVCIVNKVNDHTILIATFNLNFQSSVAQGME